MTLVMAFVGTKGAVMAGDRREITFLGEKARIETLERELYSGRIGNDRELAAKAGELGVAISIRDDKAKVREEDGGLVGEVTSLEAGLLRRRRLWVRAGSYSITDIEGPSRVERGKGGGGNFVVLGNELTKAIAGRFIRERWKNGSLEDAAGIIREAMEEAARVTPSVSREYIILWTGERTGQGKAGEKGAGREPEPQS